MQLLRFSTLHALRFSRLAFCALVLALAVKQTAYAEMFQDMTQRVKTDADPSSRAQPYALQVETTMPSVLSKNRSQPLNAFLDAIAHQARVAWHPIIMASHAFSDVLVDIAPNGQVSHFRSTPGFSPDNTAKAHQAIIQAVANTPRPAELKGKTITLKFDFTYSPTQQYYPGTISDYIEAVVKLVKAHWHPDIPGPAQQGELSFDLNRTGEATRIRMSKPFAGAAFNNLAIQAVQQVKRFPRFPVSVKDPVVHIVVTLSIVGHKSP